MTSQHEFLWGVAISAYQAEGGYNRMGEPQTNWASAELRGDVDPLGDSTRFFSHYEEDLRRCLALGLNAVRMSIEFASSQPGSMKEAHLRPLITMHSASTAGSWLHVVILGLSPS